MRVPSHSKSRLPHSGTAAWGPAIEGFYDGHETRDFHAAAICAMAALAASVAEPQTFTMLYRLQDAYGGSNACDFYGCGVVFKLDSRRCVCYTLLLVARSTACRQRMERITAV